jgi:peptidoglycan-associated lipoprotein
MLRQLPALCAGVLMLAACTNDRVSQASHPSDVAPTVAVVPGEGTIDSNVGNTVYFLTDSSLLESEAQQMLQKQALWLKEFPQYRITVEGHADERGTREYNLALGEQRAQAVMNYFIALGIDPKRLKTISFGKERPICTDPDEACWSQNRRGVSTLSD